jgi:hypothetical protein
MLCMVLIKCSVIGNPVGKFNVNRRIPRFHQLKVDKQAPGPSVTVNERMSALKFKMKTSQFRYDMLRAPDICVNELLNCRLDEVWLNRFMSCSHDTNRYTAVYTPVILLVCKHQVMNLFDDAFTQLNILFRQLTDKFKCLLVAYCLYLPTGGVYQVLSADEDFYPLCQRRAHPDHVGGNIEDN